MHHSVCLHASPPNPIPGLADDLHRIAAPVASGAKMVSPKFNLRVICAALGAFLCFAASAGFTAAAEDGKDGSKADESGNTASAATDTTLPPEAADDTQVPSRRAEPAPLDGIFPGSDYLGPTPLIGVPDTDPVYPLTKALWRLSPALKKARIK